MTEVVKKDTGANMSTKTKKVKGNRKRAQGKLKSMSNIFSEQDGKQTETIGSSGNGTLDSTEQRVGQKSSNGTGNEYDYDSSDEEDLRNTVGNIPISWYDEFEHIGYTTDGKPIRKQLTGSSKGDKLDEFVAKLEDPTFWRRVRAPLVGGTITLSDADAEMVQRVARGEFGDASARSSVYEPFENFFSCEQMRTSLSSAPVHKRSFIRSQCEAKRIGRYVHAIKMGWLKPQTTTRKLDVLEDDPEAERERTQFYDIWSSSPDDGVLKRYSAHLAAPKLPLPSTYESYNPPEEYLFTKEERAAWESQTPEERRLNFLPERFNTLRNVPAYSRFIPDRLDRCLELYLNPRRRVMRVRVPDSESLLPKLPRPEDLQPFPSNLSLVYECNEQSTVEESQPVRSVSVDAFGEYLATVGGDCVLRLFEVSTARMVRRLDLQAYASAVLRDDADEPRSINAISVAFNPSRLASPVLLVAVGLNLLLLNGGVGDRLLVSKLDSTVFVAAEQDAAAQTCLKWEQVEHSAPFGVRTIIKHERQVIEASWQARGDYFVSVQPDAEANSVVVHQLSTQRSQYPFRRSKGHVECVRFHPNRPQLLVATQRHVRIYDLAKQQLVKQLRANCDRIASLAMHASGDHVLVSTWDARVSWFDLDLADTPYRTLRYHHRAVRSCAFHNGGYPLVASASDDGRAVVTHATVYSDLSASPLIVPVKILQPQVVDCSCCLERRLKSLKDDAKLKEKAVSAFACAFHPTQPWLFVGCADGHVRLYC